MAIAAAVNSEQYYLEEGGNGALGYGKNGQHVPMFGRRTLASLVPSVTVGKTWQRTIGIQHGPAGIGCALADGRELTHSLDNIVFAYEKIGDAPPAYVETRWNNEAYVRALCPAALVGSGAILKSNQGRVYVLDDNIPRANQWVMRGYLKVDSGQADDFLGRMHWTSRSEGHFKQSTRSRRTVQTFVIIDETGFTSKGYYLAGEISPWDHGYLICHLKPIGKVKDVLRHFVTKTGERNLGPWAQNTHGAFFILFD